jgi:hypothetical protein
MLWLKGKEEYITSDDFFLEIISQSRFVHFPQYLSPMMDDSNRGLPIFSQRDDIIVSTHEQGCQMVFFSNQKSQLGQILEGLGMDHSMTIWNILRPPGNLVAIRLFFSVLVYCVKKNLATLHMNVCVKAAKLV